MATWNGSQSFNYNRQGFHMELFDKKFVEKETSLRNFQVSKFRANKLLSLNILWFVLEEVPTLMLFCIFMPAKSSANHNSSRKRKEKRQLKVSNLKTVAKQDCEINLLLFFILFSV